ncbi:MAG TPA: mycofactocin system FadH/OYE family oxidoreductase 1 [Pseudonocardia sp.]|nr:mycofactocin system FadH/OYE family oxidoreductase 1 [Pseudonocardia sp.]
MLVDSVRLGEWVAPSRVVFGPIETNLAAGRALSARHAAFYARRAAGGAGVIVTEVASVHESDWPYERAPLASVCGPGWAEVVAACRPSGALVLAGLGHAGGQGSSAYHQRALWGPSRVADVVSREVPGALEQPEIDELVDGFAAAAGLAVSAGCAGVEVNAGQHSVLRQFLSGLTNRRTDPYGADRARLLREVLTAVRGALGEGPVLGLRLCADELAPWGGIGRADTSVLLPTLAPLLDYVVPVRGSGLTVAATRPDGHTAPGFNRELTAALRAGLHAPGTGSVPAVVLQGSVVDVDMADAALADGTADLVEMTRAQLADPDLVAWLRAGRPERIRPCTLTNQHSWVRDPRNLIISDDAEPGTGYEGVEPGVGTAVPAGERSGAGPGVLVVGGGPAGLEAARVAALRGYRVHLVERAALLGGALRLAAALPGRARFGLLVGWWERELRRLGVVVRTGVAIGGAELDAAIGDGVEVVLCAGSRPSPPSFEVGPGVLVRSAAEFESAVLAGPVRAVLPVGADVVVHDPVGDWTGVGVAEQVAAAGLRCVLVTPDPVAGTQLDRTGDLAEANARLQRAGVARERYATLRAVRDGHAELVDVHTGARRTLPCTVVLDCAHRLPDDTLWQARPELARAGDCVAPRTVHEAVLEARRAICTAQNP